jgi:exonuclease VII small subunit
MSTAGVQLHGRTELWRAYREAFQEFARRVEELESQKTTGHMDRISVDRALLELERALVHYRQCRDALASALLSGRSSRFAEVQSPTHPPDDNQRVKEIAQLLWEFEARREGFADDDWYRAEEIIRSAKTADAHPSI